MSIICRMLTSITILLSLTMVTSVQAQEQSASESWDDFNHYVLIARPDLAKASAEKLMATVENDQLLEIVESSTYKDYDQTLLRAMKNDITHDVAKELESRIRSATYERSREPERIASDIMGLAEGGRREANARKRLQKAGQYAAPMMLETLTDDSKSQLHPYVMSAMVTVGRPLVYPLSVALPNLEPVAMGQVAQVLAEIGYPQALPYIKLAMESDGVDGDAMLKLQAAYEHLNRQAGLSGDTTSATLFLELSKECYSHATVGDDLPGYDPATGMGLVWVYDDLAGLVAIPVEGRAFGDVLSMRAAAMALELNPQMDDALSMWLMSNLRRENRLAGERDLSYPGELLPPAFYLKAAGPLRQHDVLEQALNDDDVELALDAIDALGATAGTDALINREGTIQPLLRALSYPDRRVRFNAAFTLTNARPEAKFTGSDRVVSVLGEAVRQQDSQFALVIGGNMETSINPLQSALKAAGYRTAGGKSLTDLVDVISSQPGIDLIVVDLPLDQIELLFTDTKMNYKLATTPVLAVVPTSEQLDFNRRFENEQRIFATAKSFVGTPKLENAIDFVVGKNTGKPITGEEALAYTQQALELLAEVALVSGKVFDVNDAQPALISALNDDRIAVVLQAAKVLTLIDSVAAQQAIANAAIDGSFELDVQIDLLNNLADSATHHGGYLNDVQLARLLELVENSDGELAETAARAHGALTLPASNVVQMITK